jgi:hypothetical protein
MNFPNPEDFFHSEKHSSLPAQSGRAVGPWPAATPRAQSSSGVDLMESFRPNFSDKNEFCQI